MEKGSVCVLNSARPTEADISTVHFHSCVVPCSLFARNTFLNYFS